VGYEDKGLTEGAEDDGGKVAEKELRALGSRFDTRRETDFADRADSQEKLAEEVI
jgi:hypothetical protein